MNVSMNASMSSEQEDDWKEHKSDDGNDKAAEWVVIGHVADRVTADFVMESLRSYEIPAVLDSKSGFFGTMGMSSIESPFSGGSGAHAILTIAEKVEEACDISKMIAGDKWEPTDSAE